MFAGLLLTMGSLGDRFGRYKFLTFGLVVFGTGSVLSAFAPSAGVLIATRSLMGIGGACIMPGTLSILSNVFRSPGERATAIGVWAGVSALGVGIGPVAGGALLTHFWWGSVFLVNVPIVIDRARARLLLRARLVRQDDAAPRPGRCRAVDRQPRRDPLVDHRGAEPRLDRRPRSSPASSSARSLVAAFFMWELKSSSPMLDLHFFQNPRFSAASAAIMLVFLALFGTIFLLTQYLQSVLGYSTLKAGAILIPQSRGADDLRVPEPAVGRAVRQQGRRRGRSRPRRDLARSGS